MRPGGCPRIGGPAPGDPPGRGHGASSARNGRAGLSTATRSPDGRAVRPRGGPAPPSRPLNINAAGAEALQALPGIGPALAARIVADREARGPFRTPEDLLRVPGIGPKRWERIRPLVRLAEEP